MTRLEEAREELDRACRKNNVEIFFVALHEQTKETRYVDDDGEPLGEGFFYWCCFPGCLPEGDPIGPFATVFDAYESACENGYILESEESND